MATPNTTGPVADGSGVGTGRAATIVGVDEAERLAALHEYGLLDVPADAELEAVLRVAAAVAGVPTATVNLIDSERQCQLTTVGFVGCDSPRDESMCAVSLSLGGFVHVPDAATDPHFADNPWVTGRMASLRFYAAAPLVTPAGFPLGTLCVFDTVPRRLTDEQIGRLEDLAAVVLALFERHRQAALQSALAREAEAARVELAVAHRLLEVRQEYLEDLNAELLDRTARLDAAVAELQRSNGELETLAAVASHDLKSPLAVVNTYLEQFQETYADRIDERGRGWLARTLGATARMCDLIESLLRYSQAGGAPIHLEPVDTAALLDTVVADLNHAVTASAARVAAGGPLPVVECDPVQVRQLLQNLIANAIKFRRPDRVPRITCTAAAGRHEWIFSVADNGVGIPAHRRDEVFTMFSRLTRIEGHGIGLATCQRIVARHGGRIWIDRARRETGADSGTTVHFSLPVRQAAG